MTINHRHLIFGLASFLPMYRGGGKTTTGGTSLAEYCYSVWLRHLVLARRNGLCQGVPPVIAELGPGDSVGIGLAALISGADRYVGLDVVKHASLEKNVAVFDRLVELFKERAAIPSGQGFQAVKPYLDSYDFPSDILPERHLQSALTESRLARIRASLFNTAAETSCITYVAPWMDEKVVGSQTLDMILSQAVMEYVEDLPGVYARMAQWLKPGGFISHQIDFKSHGTAETWDGHWACSDFVWTMMRGRRPFYLNRTVYSQHVAAIEAAGLTLVSVERVTMAPQTPRSKFNPRFRGCSPEDLSTAGAFVQAVKR